MDKEKMNARELIEKELEMVSGGGSGKGGHGVIDTCPNMKLSGMCYDGAAQDNYCLNCSSCKRYPWK